MGQARHHYALASVALEDNFAESFKESRGKVDAAGRLPKSAAVALVRPVELRRVGKRRAQMIQNAIEHHPQELVSRELAVVL
jgi:hypothetical protein